MMALKPAGTPLWSFLNRELLTLLALSVVAVSLAYQSPVAVDLNTPGLVLNGVYDLEGRASDRPYRWTDGQARIGIAGIGAQPYRLTLTLSASRPAGATLPEVRVFANNTLVQTFTAARPVRDYAFDIPADALRADGDLEIRVESDTFVPPNDLRKLGLSLYAMRLYSAADRRSVAWPAWLPLTWCMVALGLIFVACRAWVAAAWLRFVPALAVLAALCIGIAFARVQTVAVLPWLVLTSVICYTVSDGVLARRH